jgi:hypothetical protein
MEILDSWVLPGERLLACWCARRRRYHLHGNVGRGADRGALVTHCISWSGMYRLRCHGNAPAEIALDVERTRPRGPEAVLTDYATARNI